MQSGVRVTAEHFVLAELRLVLVRLREEVSMHDLVSDQNVMESVQPCVGAFRQLIDARSVVSVRLSSDEIRQLSQQSLFEPGVYRAIVAPHNAVYGLARAFEAYADLHNQRVQVFRDLDSACAWLEIPAPEIETTLRRSFE